MSCMFSLLLLLLFFFLSCITPTKRTGTCVANCCEYKVINQSNKLGLDANSVADLGGFQGFHGNPL